MQQATRSYFRYQVLPLKQSKRFLMMQLKAAFHQIPLHKLSNKCCRAPNFCSCNQNASLTNRFVQHNKFLPSAFIQPMLVEALEMKPATRSLVALATNSIVAASFALSQSTKPIQFNPIELLCYLTSHPCEGSLTESSPKASFEQYGHFRQPHCEANLNLLPSTKTATARSSHLNSPHWLA